MLRRERQSLDGLQTFLTAAADLERHSHSFGAQPVECDAEQRQYDEYRGCLLEWFHLVLSPKAEHAHGEPFSGHRQLTSSDSGISGDYLDVVPRREARRHHASRFQGQQLADSQAGPFENRFHRQRDVEKRLQFRNFRHGGL